jgi:hypothetical protein
MANMETITGKIREEGKELLLDSKEKEKEGEDKCEFEDYDTLLLMSETPKMRKLITKRGTLEILIPLCCSTNPVRYKKFRQAMKAYLCIWYMALTLLAS